MHHIKTILILFLLKILNSYAITNTEAPYLDDIIYDNFITIDKQQLINGLNYLPKFNLLTLQALVKEVKNRIVSILPLCVIYGLINLIVYDPNYRKLNSNILLTTFGRDILLSCARYFIDSDILSGISFGVLILIDILVPLFVHYNSFATIITTQYLTESQQHNLLLFIILSYTISVGYRCKTRKQTKVAIKEHQYNLTKNPKIDIINNILTIKDCEIFLYNNNTIYNKFDNIIENFSKWIANHKNDICLNTLTNVIYKPCIKDKSNTHYTDNDLIDILNKYQPGNYKNSLFYHFESSLKFQLMKHNEPLTFEFIELVLQREGVTLIETQESYAETKINNYQYIGIVNNRSCCYLFFGMELNLDYKKHSIKIADIIWQSLLYNTFNYPAVNTIAIRLININSFLVDNLVDYLGGILSKINMYKISTIIK